MQAELVRVVARRHPFQEQNEELFVRPGMSVRRILRSELNVPRELEARAFANGEPVSLGYRVKFGDFINIRVIPKGGFGAVGTTARQAVAQGVPTIGTGAISPGGASPARINQGPSFNPFTGLSRLLIGGGISGLLLFLNYLGRNNPDSVTSSPTTPTQEVPNAVNVPITGVGGEKDKLKPILTSISNQSAPWAKIPRLYGRRYFVPPVSANVFTIQKGGFQHLVACFDIGPGEHLIEDLKVGNTRITQLSSIQYELRTGLPSDLPVTLYTNDIEQLNLLEPLQRNREIIKRCPQECDEISIDVAFDRGLYKTQPVVDETGAVTGTEYVDNTVSFKVEYRLVDDTGAWTNQGTWTITSQQDVAFKRNRTWTVTTGQYDVRLTRTTVNGNGTDTVDSCQWTALRAIRYTNPFNDVKDSKGNVVPMCRMAIDVTSSEETQGALEQINCIATAKLRTWDGSAWTAPIATSNPAWILVDILTGVNNASPVADEDLDLVTLKDWADWCGENNYLFNHTFDTEGTIQQAIDLVCAVGNAQFTIRNGKYSVVQDKLRSTIVQHFTNRNILRGTFRSQKYFYDQPHATRARFVSDYNWDTDERVVFDDGFTDYNNAERVELVGITNPTQVYKYCRRLMAQRRLRPETFEFKADVENIVCTLGDLIRFTNDVARFGLLSARIKSLVTNGGGDILEIVLDSRFTMTAEELYAVRVRTVNGSEVYNVTTVEGENNTLTLSTAILNAAVPKPAVGDLVQFGIRGTESVELVVTRIEPGENLTAVIQCVDHAPAIALAESGPVPPYDPQQSFPSDAVFIPDKPRILSVRSDETALVRQSDGSLQSYIRVTLDMPLDSRVVRNVYQYKTSASGPEGWSAPFPLDALVGDINIGPVVDGVEYDVRIRAVASNNRVSEWNMEITNHKVIGKTTPPPDVPVFQQAPGFTNVLEWYDGPEYGVIMPIDFAGYELRMNWGFDLNYERATIIAPLLLTKRFDIGGLGRGFKTFLLKAVDMAGNKSENAIVLFKDYGDIDVENVVIQVDHHPDFPGTKTDCSVVGGVLKTTQVGTLHWNSNPATRHWQADTSQLYWTTLFNEGTYEFSEIFSTEFVGSRIYINSEIIGPHKIEYFAPQTNAYWQYPASLPHWSANPSDLHWSQTAWQWLPFPTNGIDHTGKEIRIKITMYGGTVQTEINSLSLVLDVPDQAEEIQQVITAANNRLALTLPWKKIKTVNITLLKEAPYTAANVANLLDRDEIQGPAIEILDSPGGSVVDGFVLATVRGY